MSIQGGQPQFRRTVTFAPRCPVRVTTEEIAYYVVDGFEQWYFDKPSLNLQVTATFEGATFSLRGEPDASVKDSWEVSMDAANGSATWRINGAMLPGQGISFWWSLVEDEP